MFSVSYGDQSDPLKEVCGLTGCMLISQPVFSPGSFILSKPKRASMSSVNWLRSSRLSADMEDPSSLIQTRNNFNVLFSLGNTNFTSVSSLYLWQTTLAKLTGFLGLLHFGPCPICIVRCSAKPSCVVLSLAVNNASYQLNPKSRRINNVCHIGKHMQ